VGEKLLKGMRAPALLQQSTEYTFNLRTQEWSFC